MAKAEASVEELVGMIERASCACRKCSVGTYGARHVFATCSTRFIEGTLPAPSCSGNRRGSADAGNGGHPTDQPYQSTRLLLDGQQRLTSLSAVIRGESVKVRGRKKPIDLLFNLDIPITWQL